MTRLSKTKAPCITTHSSWPMDAHSPLLISPLFCWRIFKNDAAR